MWQQGTGWSRRDGRCLRRRWRQQGLVISLSYLDCWGGWQCWHHHHHHPNTTTSRSCWTTSNNSSSYGSYRSVRGVTGKERGGVVKASCCCCLGGVRKWACPQCSTVRGSMNGCDTQIRQAHTGKVLLCGLCGFSTYNLDSLSRHEKEHN